MTWFLLTVAGSLGAVARYLLGALVQRRTRLDLPLGTAAVNLLGALAIGLATGFTGQGQILVLGFLGGFTTFSTWMVETVELLEVPERRLAAAINLAGMAAVGIALAAVGAAVAR